MLHIKSIINSKVLNQQFKKMGKCLKSLPLLSEQRTNYATLVHSVIIYDY